MMSVIAGRQKKGFEEGMQPTACLLFIQSDTPQLEDLTQRRQAAKEPALQAQALRLSALA